MQNEKDQKAGPVTAKTSEPIRTTLDNRTCSIAQPNSLTGAMDDCNGQDMSDERQASVAILAEPRYIPIVTLVGGVVIFLACVIPTLRSTLFQQSMTIAESSQNDFFFVAAIQASLLAMPIVIVLARRYLMWSRKYLAGSIWKNVFCLIGILLSLTPVWLMLFSIISGLIA